MNASPGPEIPQDPSPWGYLVLGLVLENLSVVAWMGVLPAGLLPEPLLLAVKWLGLPLGLAATYVFLVRYRAIVQRRLRQQKQKSPDA